MAHIYIRNDQPSSKPRYRVLFRVNQKTVSLGTFDTYEEAVQVEKRFIENNAKKLRGVGRPRKQEHTWQKWQMDSEIVNKENQQ